MEIKTITLDQASNFYPANYDYEILKKYDLYDQKFNDKYLYYYSYYRFYLEKYLSKVLDLPSLNNELNYESPISNFYQEISSLNLSNVFIRNNIYLDHLTEAEFHTFQNLCSSNIDTELENFIINTYKKVIVFDINLSLENTVNYDELYGGLLTYNNALVIGVLSDKEINFKDLEIKYTKILNIPVTIFNYHQINNLNKEVYLVENLNLINEKKQKDILSRYPKYLPLGSIVILKNGWKKLMIMGYSPVNISNKKETYDYCGCLYPEGVVRSDFNILFNHEDIKEIKAIGLIDEEQQIFMQKLPNMIKASIDK